MPDQVTNYKCPSCGGPLHFDPDTQKVKCDNCGSTFSVAQIEEEYADENAQAIAASENYEPDETLQWSEDEAKQLRAYSCPSCGAQLIMDLNTAATSCPYCTNPTIVPSQLEGALRPDYIIPFKLKKDEAIKKLQSYYGGKPFLPSAFTRGNHIEEIKGIYVPFWLYDGEADIDVTYDATQSHIRHEGKATVTKTDHYLIQRSGSVTFEMVPADASSKMDDPLMDSLEPFDYQELVSFELSYLPGYLADKYDISVEDNTARAETRMKRSALDAVRRTVVGYDSVVEQRTKLDIIPDRVHYAFLPIWYLTTKWNNETYVFAMNGQTGKFIGDLPVDMKKFWITLILISVIGIAILWFLLLR